MTDSYEADEDVAALLDRAERAILEISQGKATSGFADLQSVLKDSFRQLETLSARKDPITGLPTGFSDLDRQTAGLQPSDLIVIAGRPSMGKTTLALNVAAYAGMQTGKPIAVFSLEMSKEQMALRMLCAEARVDSAKPAHRVPGRQRLEPADHRRRGPVGSGQHLHRRHPHADGARHPRQGPPPAQRAG